MEVIAITRSARMSAFKGRPLARACQGLTAAEALKVVAANGRDMDAARAKGTSEALLDRLMLDEGRIVEDGTYEELIARNGRFAELVARQRLDV